MVMSTMAALWPDSIVGTAPKANYYLFHTENDLSETRQEEYNWVVAAERADSLGVQVLNTSLGYSIMDDESQNYSYQDMDGNTTIITQAADIAASKGMLVINSAGNSGTNTFYVTVFNSLATGDVTAPKIMQPNMITVDATTANGAVVTYKTPIATDNTEVTYGPVCTPKSGSFFEIGSNTVTCIAKDKAGNQGSVAFLVKVDSKIAIPKEVKTSVSVNVGKEQYQNDEAIFITGSANPSSKEKVSLEIRDSLSNLVGIEQADVEEFGSYTAIVFPSQLWNVNGTYSMTAMYGSSQNSADFDFLILPEDVQQTPFAITPTQLNIKKYESGVFDAGDVIEISNSNETLEIFSPKNTDNINLNNFTTEK